jgi:hypothetical protein
MERKELMLDLGQFDHNELLSEWRWLVDDSYTPLVLTAMGDMFLTSPDGKVHFLDLMEGQFSVVSDSVKEFQEKLHDPEIVAKWFLPEVVETNMAIGMTLGAKECYGMGIPAFLSGKLEPDNIEPIDVYVYYSVTGQLLNQVKDLPPGTKIDKIKVSSDSRNIFRSLWKKIFK